MLADEKLTVHATGLYVAVGATPEVDPIGAAKGTTAIAAQAAPFEANNAMQDVEAV